MHNYYALSVELCPFKMCTNVLLVVAFIPVALSTVYDGTIQPRAIGSSVVETVLLRIESSCIFQDDKLLMRRMAFIESSDGNDPKIFRPGYYGGIWQVDQDMFNFATSISLTYHLYREMFGIQKTFGIYWDRDVTWEDLVKPLYSALAARLILQYSSSNAMIPGPIKLQAKFWKRYYRFKADSVYVGYFGNLFIDQECKSNGADIIFILDSSRSIGDKNFTSMKQFVKTVVSSLDVGMGPHQNRIGLIQISLTSRIEFYLNTYTTDADINQAIDRTEYLNLDTRTDRALDLLVSSGFIPANGARSQREGHPWIGIVITDGQSNEPEVTKASSKYVHDANITMIAVGINSKGFEQELMTIASEPVCRNVIQLSNFAEIDELNHVIERRTCEAPVIISKDHPITVELPAGRNQNCKINVPSKGGTVQIKTETGGVTYFYISSTTYPSKHYYEDKVESRSGRAGFLYISSTGNSSGVVFGSVSSGDATPSTVTLTVEEGYTVPAAPVSSCDRIFVMKAILGLLAVSLLASGIRI